MIHIDMQMPDSCSECRFETKRGFCKAMQDNFCGLTNDEGRPEWCPLEEQENEYENGFNDDMQDKRELMYEGIDGKWHKKDW